MQGTYATYAPHMYLTGSWDQHEVQRLEFPLACANPSNGSTASPPYVQHGTALPAVTLNQLLKSYLEQQQQALDRAALLAYIMSSLQSSASTAATPQLQQQAWQLQGPGLYSDAQAAAAWQMQTTLPAPNILSSQTQLAGLNAAPCAAAFPQPHTMWAVQQSNCASQGTDDLLAAEVQLQRLLSGFQIPFGSLDNAYTSHTPLSTVNASSATSTSSFGAPANGNQHTAAAAPTSLELSLAKLGLQNSGSHSSSSSSYNSLASTYTSSSSSSSTDSPSRTSSLLSSSGSWGSAALSNVLAAASASVSSFSDSQDEDDLPVVHNHFCRQEISLALNATVTVLLNTLRSLQYAGENPYPKLHRLYVCGLRESCKAIKSGKAKAVLLAPDIQVTKFGKADRVLDGRMNDIILNSQMPRPGCAPVPVVFALSRKKIGQVFGSKKRMSAIALLDVSGVEDLFSMMLQLAEEGRQQWAEMQNWVAGIHDALV